MDGPSIHVRIIDMFVFVYHGMEPVVDVAMVGEVVVGLLHEVRVLRGDDSPVEDAIAYTPMHEAVFITQDTSLVDVTRV
jgi:hypothetical protein